ncbi:MAG: exosortase/archaeosortase family protein [Chthonomonadales bacterium]|nr:exosortase/archaeosortase family protein [Chthonomonadales bacterium]
MDEAPDRPIETDTVATVSGTTVDSATSSEVERRRFPLIEKLAWLAVAIVYAPVIIEYAHEWMIDERYSHGWLIIPISAGLLYMRRDRFIAAMGAGSSLALALVLLGLIAHLGAWYLQFPHVGMWSLVLVLYGMILALYGRAAWRVARFSTLFLLFAGTWPNRLIEPINLKVQSISAAGAADFMAFLGFAVMREGNRIEVPGHVVEVADICSGYKKTVALLAFAFLYGHVMTTTPFRRVVLCLSAIPIAVLANVGRVAALVLITGASGSEGLARAHDPAEMVALGVAFVLFIAFGKALGCRLPEQL